MEFVERGATVNPEQYVHTLKNLKQRFGRGWPNWKMNHVLRLYENTRLHSNLRTREAITKTGWNARPNPPYSPDIAPTAFHSVAT